MRAKVLVLCAGVLPMIAAAAPLCAQGEVTTAPVATGFYNSFTLVCPPNMLVIGASSRDGVPDSFDCSMYQADGHRFGTPMTVAFPPSNNPITKFIEATNPIRPPLVTVSCPGDQALTSLRTHIDPTHERLGIDYVDVYCAGVGANGGQTISTKAGNMPTSPIRTPNGAVTCPVTKFAKGMVGVSGGIALDCIDAPVIANTVASVSLSSQHTVSGTAVQGTVTLNGNAVGPISVALSVVGAPGAVLPTSVTVPDGAHFTTFQVQSALSTAGCSTVKATLGATTVSDPLIFTPAPPGGASFSFSLQPESASLLWGAPSTITAVVVFPSTRGTLTVGGKIQPSVTFQSDQPTSWPFSRRLSVWWATR
jgi:hypothetical protein